MSNRLAALAMLALMLVLAPGCAQPVQRPVAQPAVQPRPTTPGLPTSMPAIAPPKTQRAPPVSGPDQAVRPSPPVVQPEPPEPEPAKPELPLPPPRGPARPEDSWVIFREAFEEAQDAECKAEWTGGNRLEVTTQNVKRLTVDLRMLPEGAPQKGPWNLQIDGQGIELTGFEPKPGYTGRIRDLVRSPNGVWTVDRKALYRIRG